MTSLHGEPQSAYRLQSATVLHESGEKEVPESRRRHPYLARPEARGYRRPMLLDRLYCSQHHLPRGIALSGQDRACHRLSTRPGFGPVSCFEDDEATTQTERLEES